MYFSTRASDGGPFERMRIVSGGWAKFTSTGTYNDLNAQNHEFVNGTEGNNSHFIGNTSTNFGGASLLRLNCSRVTTNGTYNFTTLSTNEAVEFEAWNKTYDGGGSGDLLRLLRLRRHLDGGRGNQAARA
jgi:hypothetical protein